MLYTKEQVDKAIDLAYKSLLATSAAKEYSPNGSYVPGDYCTHDGKLHKCSTPIPSGETWNAAHWTETTVAAELAGKVNATPPQKQNLILSSGWSVADNSMSIFYKTQENIVHVIINAKTSSPVAEGDTIATLPVTYRPSKFFRVPIIYRLVDSGNLATGHLDIGENGTIRIYNCTTDAGVAEMYVNPFEFPEGN